MKYIRALYLSVFFYVAFGSCVRDNVDSRKLVVSIEPQRYLLEQIVGDKMTVSSLLSKGDNPENFDPSISSLMDVEKGRAYFSIGLMGFEDALIKRAVQSKPDIKVVDCSAGIDYIADEHHAGGGNVHLHSVDPHIWSSVKNAKIIACNMYNAVVDIDPDNEEYYTERYKVLQVRLDSLDAGLTHKLAPYRGKAFIVWHPSLSYFARDYGLEQIAIGFDNKEMSVTSLQSKIDESLSHHAAVFLVQADYDGEKSQNIADYTGAKSVIINPLNYEWEEEMIHTANAIISCNVR